VATGVPGSGKPPIGQMLAERHRHFMQASRLDSQFEAREPPGAAENLISTRIDETVGAIVDEIVTALSLPAATMTEPM
jgi:gluconokinase